MRGLARPSRRSGLPNGNAITREGKGFVVDS
jgi:hypothetical protein